jgi:hypothetical protein
MIKNYIDKIILLANVMIKNHTDKIILFANVALVLTIFICAPISSGFPNLDNSLPVPSWLGLLMGINIAFSFISNSTAKIFRWSAAGIFVVMCLSHLVIGMALGGAGVR